MKGIDEMRLSCEFECGDTIKRKQKLNDERIITTMGEAFFVDRFDTHKQCAVIIVWCANHYIDDYLYAFHYHMMGTLKKKGE